MLRTVTNKVKYLAIFCRENISILTKPYTVDVSGFNRELPTLHTNKCYGIGSGSAWIRIHFWSAGSESRRAKKTHKSEEILSSQVC